MGGLVAVAVAAVIVALGFVIDAASGIKSAHSDNNDNNDDDKSNNGAI